MVPALQSRGAGMRSWLLHTLLFLTVIFWLPYFAGQVVPIHDTLYVVESFHCFYSELIAHHELARWFPYGNYGMQADLYQMALHPTLYVAGLAGWLTGVHDTLILAKLAMLLNELLFAFGLFLCCRELYSHPVTQFLVSVGGVLSVSWLEQAMFNFFVFYLLPLVLFLVLKFFRTGHPSYLFLAGIVEVCSLLGNVLYIAPLHFWVLVLFAVPLLWENPRPLARLFRPAVAVNPWLWGLIGISALIGVFIAGSTQGLTLLSLGRDPATGRVLLDTFLSYGRPPMGTAICGLLTGGTPHGPNTYYVGLLPLVMFAYALATERRPAFLGIATGCFALAGLSLGGLWAKTFYYLPGMNIYRHIALIYGIVGLLLLLGAGFGIDRLMRRLKGDQPTGEQGCRRWQLACVLAVGCLLLIDLHGARRPEDFGDPHLHLGWKAFFAWRVGVYTAALAGVFIALRRPQSSLSGRLSLPMILVALAYLADMGSFRLQVLLAMPIFNQAREAASLFHVEPIPYRKFRSDAPADPRGRIAIDVLGQKFPDCNNSQYGLCCTFAGIDPCRPLFRADAISSGIDQMIRTRGGNPELHPTDAYLPSLDEPFLRSIGCGAPKLRLVENGIVAADQAEEARLFAELADPVSTIVLAPESEAGNKDLDGQATTEEGAIDVVSFSMNRLCVRARVTGPAPQWLVYADAWHPGWKAEIDGKPADVVRANLGFKCVRLDAGDHDVTFYFRGRKRTWLAHGVALIGTLSGLGLCSAMLVLWGLSIKNRLNTRNES